jgi:hypothetical protein
MNVRDISNVWTKSWKSGPNHGKVHECGRGEVHSPISGDVSHNQLSFFNDFSKVAEAQVDISQLSITF